MSHYLLGDVINIIVSDHAVKRFRQRTGIKNADRSEIIDFLMTVLRERNYDHIRNNFTNNSDNEHRFVVRCSVPESKHEYYDFILARSASVGYIDHEAFAYMLVSVIYPNRRCRKNCKSSLKAFHPRRKKNMKKAVRDVKCCSDAIDLLGDQFAGDGSLLGDDI